MKKVICTTTIHEPTPALIAFCAMRDWELVIAGDKNTPESYENGIGSPLIGFHYLSDADQEAMDTKLSDLIGWNCIQRRNFAFLFACKELKADIVATIDDDNIPGENWGKQVFVGQDVQSDEYGLSEDAFDPLQITVHSRLWHRGFPLELVKDRYKQLIKVSRRVRKCDVQADLWNGEPDVDAICRLAYDTSECRFKTPPFPYTSNKPSPFNSQNTFLSKEVMPHYFMFPGIGRMDDIWASYHVQAQGFRVMYSGPTVVQKRNEHNLVTDLLNEVIGMQNNLAIVKEVPTNKNAVLDRLPPRSLEAFKQYQSHFE